MEELPMTPTRLRECLALLRWSQRGLAEALDRPEGTVRQWARGAVRVPEPVADWLDRAGRWHAKNPPPPREGQPPSSQ
jgi:hypothetical protein